MAASATAGKANAASTKKVESINMDSKYSVSNIASIAPKMDSRVLKAYKKLGFTIRLLTTEAALTHIQEASSFVLRMRQSTMNWDISLLLLRET